MTITEFLLARIAEDEANIKGDWAAGDGGLHIIGSAMHGRMLAECAAKRAIVERYAENLDRAMAYRNPRWRDAMTDADRIEHRLQEARLATSLEDCRSLAAAYASHPDYREDW